MNRIFLNGSGTFPFYSQEELLKYINDKKKILIAINTEKILSKDTVLKSIINNNIGYPDGIGAVMALKRKGVNAAKIAGAKLWLDIIKKYHHRKSFYLIGSTQEVIVKTYEELITQFPAIKIKNYKNGYFNREDLAYIIQDIKNKAPDIIFVAMGSPKQEYIMHELIKNYPAQYVGLGGSFDLFCMKARPVPEWWIRIFKWEGLYRAFNDFTNIKRWKRQFFALKIIYWILFDKL
jgi:UDP-N-acetyl-D-mannosaminouronate:lipid I N-acetyl-D-mannosaminouronosyltransferase